MSYEVKNCEFVRNKLIIKAFVNSHLHLKHKSIFLSFLKFILSESREKYAQIKYCLQVETVQNCSKQIFWWILMWEHNRRWTFSLEEALLLWVVDLYLKLEHLNDRFVSYKHAAFCFTRC